MEWASRITAFGTVTVLALVSGQPLAVRAQGTPSAAPTVHEAQLPTGLLSPEQPSDYGRFVSAEVEAELAAGQPVPMLTQPWWREPAAVRGTGIDPSGGWELDQLIWLAIEHSPLVLSVLVEPQILQAQAVAASGEFDPTAFVDSIFKDTSDPVGNTLITGSAGRLNEHAWNNSSGLRVKNTRGGVSELAQDFNFVDNNSNFFVPANQADTKLALRYTQPLKRGAGVAYNRSTIVVASLNAEQSRREAAKRIQEHVFDITNAYWELVVARASVRQIDRGLLSLAELRDQLVGRADIDTLKSQQLRAESAIYRQQAARAKAFAQLQTAEATLRAEVAAPQLLNHPEQELIPITPSADWNTAVSRESELAAALSNHPDIQAIRISLQTSRVKLQVAENELRPTLNLVLESYLRGLNGDFDAVKSFGDQFSTGAPSYSAGLNYLRPHRNTAATAILRERRLELRRGLLELDHTLLSVAANVEGAVARLQAAYSDLEAAVQSTLAIHAELEYLTARWQNAFLDGTARNLLLDQLLNAQLQLIQAENGWSRAQADHMLALANLQLATGALIPVTTSIEQGLMAP